MLVYFTSDEVKNADQLRELGLGHIFETTTDLVRVPCFNGPHGFSCVWGSRLSIAEARIGNFPARQRVQSFGKFAIAESTDEAFRPESLLRPSPLSSHTWQDHRGRTWQIPIARRWIKSGGEFRKRCEVPHCYAIGEDGQWVVDSVVDQYAKLWDIATQFDIDRMAAFTAADGSEQVSIPLPSLDSVCDHVFGANYRVSKFEMSFLKVITDQTSYDVMKLVVDDPGAELLQKKTE